MSPFYCLEDLKQFVSNGCVEKKARSGRPRKINERGERIFYRAIKKNLRFGTLKAIVEDFANLKFTKLQPDIL